MRIYEAHPDKIIGIKEASGNIDQIKHLIHLSTLSDSGLSTLSPKDGLLVLSGDDGIACELMEAGAAGLISVASNAFPKDFARIVHAKDAALQKRYDHMVHLLFAEGNPTGIKAVLAQKGLITNSLRLPLVPASDTLFAQIRDEVLAIQGE
jgi:4-hydroxy-tetrahydrodipicolinate synthase